MELNSWDWGHGAAGPEEPGQKPLPSQGNEWLV